MEQRITLLEVITKYKNAWKNTGSTVGGSLFGAAVINSGFFSEKVYGSKPTERVDINFGSLYGNPNIHLHNNSFNEFFDAFIASLEAINSSNETEEQKLKAALLNQHQFATEMRKYTGQKVVDVSIVTHFLQLFREQIRFSTNDLGERIKDKAGKDIENYNFLSIYPTLAAVPGEQGRNEAVLYNAFKADCDNWYNQYAPSTQQSQPTTIQPTHNF